MNKEVLILGPVAVNYVTSTVDISVEDGFEFSDFMNGCPLILEELMKTGKLQKFVLHIHE